LGGGVKGCTLDQWCPAENIYNSSATQIYDLDGVDQQTLNIKSTITFPTFNNKITFTPSGNQAIVYPNDNPNTFTLEDILIMAGTTYEDVRYIGAVFRFDIMWNCDYDIFNCKSTFLITNLDEKNSTGYTNYFAKPYLLNGVATRDEYHYSAIKIYVNVLGTGAKTEFVNVFMEIFIFVTLLFTCQYITDFLMTNFYREKKHYSELKYTDVSNLDEIE